MKSSATYLTETIKANGFPASEETSWLYDSFPDGFVWGVSTAAYSVSIPYFETRRVLLVLYIYTIIYITKQTSVCKSIHS